MKDYWSELQLNECWSQKQRYNILMTYIDEKLGATEEVEETEEPELSSIAVSVTDGTDGIGNINVVLSDGTNEYTGKTGGAGGCTIKDVPYGEYTVSVEAEGYNAYEDTFTVDSAEEELTIQLVEATAEPDPEEPQVP